MRSRETNAVKFWRVQTENDTNKTISGVENSDLRQILDVSLFQGDTNNRSLNYLAVHATTDIISEIIHYG